MTKVSSLVSAGIGDTLSNIKNWGGLFYNAGDHGILPGADVTAKLQELVNLANSEGRTTIVLPAGVYTVTAIQNDSNIIYFGDGASFAGGYTKIINKFSDYISISAQLAERVKKGELFVNVKDYGAIGDWNGTSGADNTLAIQSAIDALGTAGGGTLKIPAGNYKYTSTLVNNSVYPIIIQGDGSTSILTAAFNGIGINITSDNGIKINNLKLVHSGASGAILLLDGDNCLVENCSFEGSANSTDYLVISYGSNNIIKGNGFTVNNANAFAVLVTAKTGQLNINSMMHENIFYGIGNGIAVSTDNPGIRPEGLTILGNKIITTGGYNLLIKAGIGIDISHNILDQSSINAILFNFMVENAANVSINNNAYISTASNKNGGLAIQVSDSVNTVSGLSIQNNNIVDSGYAIHLNSKAINNTISGNKMTNILQTCITIGNSGNSIVSNNEVINSNFSIVAADGASGAKYIITSNLFNSNYIYTKTTAANWIDSNNFY